MDKKATTDKEERAVINSAYEREFQIAHVRDNFLDMFEGGEGEVILALFWTI